LLPPLREYFPEYQPAHFLKKRTYEEFVTSTTGISTLGPYSKPPTALAVGIQLVELIEELREVSEDKELDEKNALDRLNKTKSCLESLKYLFNIKEPMSIEELNAIASNPDLLSEKDHDRYYYSILSSYLSIGPNKHGLKPEFLLWSQEKVRHYLDETRVSHIWKEICPLREWVFHKALEKKRAKLQKSGAPPDKLEKKTQYQNWPAVVFPLLLKDHFLAKIKANQAGIPEVRVINNTTLAKRRQKRDQTRLERISHLSSF
jgi:hypothetical protein